MLQLQHDHNVRMFSATDLHEQIVKAFPQDKYEFVNAYMGSRPRDNDRPSLAERSVYFNLPRSALSGLRIRSTIVLWKFLKEERFDVVICHRFRPTSMILRLAKWVGNPDCISVIHSFSDYRARSRLAFISRNASSHSHFIAVSDALREHLIRLNSGFSVKNTSTITNAIDMAAIAKLQYEKDEARKKLGVKADATLIGAIGRLVTVKGHVYLIQAFARLTERYPNAQLLIIGEGSQRKALEDTARALNIQDKVQLPGEIDGAVRYTKAFDIWTMPSLSEGLGLALLEGMSAGLPCIASDIPAMRPLIDGAGGIACTPGSIEELTEALDAYLSMTQEQRKQNGLAAYDYLIQNHNIDYYQATYRQLVERLINDR
ncbi:putative glycosyl transferase [Methylophaga lonarensis MPL]|uniref:Putative glycosyl transferase n=1 Tax=Methylophaga lonarensis MPL TaxID=1286106 RepID=M7P2F2_9GAMM|nr:glycosyltransferase [Methylophaga lonarensis]EMR13672.1 putative glycosyl transferase [Methylophaga lonarensis MPL]